MTPGSTKPGRNIPKAIALVASLLIGGCSSGAVPLPPVEPSYLGAGNSESIAAEPDNFSSHVTSGKVLSAIVFERVTGLEVDPARLVER
ncbi:MAG: hypothetical protein MUC37_02310 [Hyphomicrobium sp.]|jgi:hypothetical protein|nr:hypothetical protein [Hyphomicrobium sp.]